jgi:hypothetical protein
MPLSKVNRPGLNTGVTDNSDATAITIDSSENVIFAGNVDTADVRNTGDLSLTAFSSNTSINSGLSAKILLDQVGTGYGQIAMTTGGGGAGTFTGMNIDPNGRVTIPNTPAFTVNGVSAVSTTPGSSQVLNFGSIILNNGNYFNISTDRFVAPVAGHYFFAYSCMTTTQSHTSNIVIRRNGSGRHSSYTQNATYLRHNIAVVEYLAVNDYVDIVLEHGGVHGGFDHFSGFLIG